MDQPGGFSNQQHKTGYTIAKYLSERKAEDKDEISSMSLELLREVGKERFAKLVMFYVDQINRSPAGKSAGPGFLHGKTIGIEDEHRALIRAVHDRLQREAREAFYAFILEHIPADVIVWGCLPNTSDQEAATRARPGGQPLLKRSKPGKAKAKRDIDRVKDRSIHLNRTIDGNSESDDEHPSLGPVVDLDALGESSGEDEDCEKKNAEREKLDIKALKRRSLRDADEVVQREVREEESPSLGGEDDELEQMSGIVASEEEARASKKASLALEAEGLVR